MSSIIMAANAVSNGMAVFKPLYWLFGKCMEFLLDVLNNQYFIALIIFTVVTRLLLLPLNVKQQKSMAATTRLQPKIQKINKNILTRETGTSLTGKCRNFMQERVITLCKWAVDL